MAASAKRDRSVGRRLSHFFLPGANNSSSSASNDNNPPVDANRPVSRGRPDDQALRKASLPLQPPLPLHSRHTPANSGSDHALSARNSARPSVDGLPMTPPRAPFAQRPSSAPGSRSASPSSRSRNASPAPALLHPNAAAAAAPMESSPLLQQQLGLQPSEPPPTQAPALAEPDKSKLTKRRTWLPGAKEKPKAGPTPAIALPAAWIAGHNDKIAYDISHLVESRPVPELWDDAGDTFVHLFPQTSGRGPSFRVHSTIISTSAMLTQLAFGDLYTKGSHKTANGKHSRESSATHAAKPPVLPPIGQLAEEDNSSSSASSHGTRRHADEVAPDQTPPQIHLYVPILSMGGALSSANKDGNANVTKEDVDALVAVRNMFAFLVGQSLVATERRPTVFSTFLKIGDSLLSYGFTNLDGSTFGEVAALSFESYVEELDLADVRTSREKTIEALVLGERLRSVALYNEAFVHAVGKYADIHEVCQIPGAAAKYDLLSNITRNRMERASIDLLSREKSANTRLGDFYFPSVFAGILDSKTADERKQVRFGAWKEQFLSTRKHVVSYLKDKYGSWPPKASSKKNNLERSGLNRLVLRELYEDFADLYDLYADRSTVTARTNNAYLPDVHEDPAEEEEPVSRVLWRVFDEYDRSHPPVQPPVPFDLPLLPTLSDHVAMTGDAKKDTKVKQKKLKDVDSARVMSAACNNDVLETKGKTSPFLQSMLQWERKNAKGCNIIQLADMRAGTWIFCYAVIQALPLLVVDAPGVNFTKGVEYFLCEPPRHGVPWANPDATGRGRVSRSWYGVSGGAGVVSLPSDLVEHGVEGVYRRSHCWTRGKEWSHALGLEDIPVVAGAATEHEQAHNFTDVNYSGHASRSSSDAAAHLGSRTGSYTGLNTLAPPGAAGAGAALSLPGSPHGSRPGTPRAVSQERRKSALALGLETLPLPPGVAPHGVHGPSGLSPASAAGPAMIHVPRSRPTTRDGLSATPATASSTGGKSFDAIIADMEADKQSKKGKKKK